MPDGIEIYFSASLASDQREMVEQSIASAVERTRAEAAAARARSAEEDKLRDAITARLATLIRADTGVAETLEGVGKRPIKAEGSLRLRGPPGRARDRVIPVSPTDSSVELRRPPYDFAWRWYHDEGAPPFTQSGDQEGRLGVDARAGGGVAGGASRFVHAHIGVGCIVRTDRPIAVELFAPRLSRHSFAIGAHGIGASATSEGGLEATFMRGGEVLMAGTFPWWRRHGSGLSEHESVRTDFTSVFPGGMGGRIDPGEYTFNVGIWAFADYSSGIGSAGVQSLVESNIIEMQIHRRN
ncbi:MAG: hypothetical protein E5X53_17325 [Mesorhizobium sp.]|uniref:hypothetical protein n=1 Tax=Mesorhizobium sp. TaxID=1871066 RepID=UPI000FE9CF47|nr:hypothetical protein [Mesorhizobium sp.]RWM11230.1 MAG: hypothetical protein EOR73_32375 [Mesorhizobium sp.]TIP73321.1 MAG: hypothetical protein E5X55_14465 [Mesorhizobium sp.]TIQ11344.1 MAG: hypothetical protein E5X57_18370 [Mesorhizobium sp.]TIR50925.1 MAG: hypothetical protein E5X53_17325 [Mesorhizobium sp.]TJV97355.1 MAG: hypothetical protein E5X52_14855 [Mesorhizobium sp.]